MHRIAASSKPLPPPGQRPPPPPLGPHLRLLAWMLLGVAVLLYRYAAPLRRWAEIAVLPPTLPADVPPFPIAVPTLTQLVAHSMLALLQPAVLIPIIIGLQLAVFGLIGAVLLMGLLALIRTFNQQAMASTTLRLRVLPEQRDPLRDTDLLRTLHALLPVRPLAALVGREPAVSLILYGTPGAPVEVRIHVRAPTTAELAPLTAAIRAACIGHAPGCVLEPVSALPAAHLVGARLTWRRFRMDGPRDLPLRTLADSVGDPLATLAAALRPSHTDVLAAECHLRLRPLRGWMLTHGWRAAGLRRLLRLQQRTAHALRADAQRLETRLATPAFAVALHVALTTRGPSAAAHATAAVHRMQAAFDVLAERTGPWRQALRSIQHGQTSFASAWGMTAYLRMATRPAMPIGLSRLLLPLPAPQPDLVLSVDELVCLWHLPTTTTTDLLDRLPNRHLPAPLHALVGPDQNQATIVLGHAQGPDDALHDVGVTLSDLRYVLHLTAGMGAGKSRLLANLCRQFVPAGFCLIDGKGDDAGGLSSFVLDTIPLDAEERVILLDPGDARWPIGINPLSGIDLQQPGATDLAVANVFALFARIDPETWGAAQGMKDFLDKGLRLVLASEPHPTLAHVKQALLDPDYRRTLLERCRNRDVVEYWQVVFPHIGENQRSSRDALLRRFDKLLSSDLLRLMIAQPEPRLAMDRAIADRAILVIPIPNVALGDLAGVYAMVVFQQFLRAAFARPGTDQTRADYPLVVDELQVLIAEAANDDIETALSRLRAFGVPLILAHQALSQLGPVEPLVQINAENRIILKTREPDAGVYARQYAHTGLSAGDISNQDPNQHQYAVLRCHGRPAGPFSMQPLPWPEPERARLREPLRPPWQTQLPADAAATPELATLYQRVQDLVYTEWPSDELDRRAAALAALPADEFTLLLASWERVRQTHLDVLRRYPGCIPGKRERLRWRVRLQYAMPYVLAEAIYRRSRPDIAPEAPAAGRARGNSAGAAAAAPDAPGAPPEAPPFTQADRSPPPAPHRGPSFPREDDDG